MSDPEFINPESLCGSIDWKSAGTKGCDQACETVEQVVQRYTDGYDNWLESTNTKEMTDCDCVCVAVEDIQILIKRIAELEAIPKD
jgi:hypothetical protein